MLRPAFLVLLLVSQAWLASAREGYVRSRDGHIYEGHFRFESNSVIVVNALQELWAQVALSNVSELVFLGPMTDGPRPAIPASLGAWEGEDVGSVRWSGRTERTPEGFRVYGSGTNILAGSDAFHFVFRRVTGSTEIMARVAHVSLTDPWARAGLMMRDGLKADARHVFVSVSAARGGVFENRSQPGADTAVTLDSAMGLGSWLKLKRDGDRFAAFKSVNGKRWTLVERVTLPAVQDLCVGMAVVGVRQETLNYSVFEGVEEGPRIRNRWFTPELELRSGSMQRGHLASLDESVFHFEGRPPREPVSRSSVANIRFQPLPREAGKLLNSGRKGVLLHTGEFIDGECHGLSGGTLTLNSIPLGLCRYDLGVEVVALVLHARGVPARAVCRVLTADGSTWVGTEATLDPDGIRLREPTLGLRRIAWPDILEFHRRG
jgi:hypothetical protein